MTTPPGLEPLLDAAERFLRERALTSSRRCLAEVGPVQVTGVRLIARDGSSPAWGISRCPGAESTAVATAEAVEHLVATGGTPDLLGADRAIDGSAVGTEGPSVFGDQLMAWLRRRGAGREVLCREYRRVLGAGPSRALLPRFLVDLGHWRETLVPERLRPFVRYGNSTGWSVATSAEDAFRRGMLEVLERDALSRFMLSVFLARPFPCAFLALRSAPEDVLDIVRPAEIWLDGEISVVVVRLGAGIHVCFASTPDRTRVGRIVGKGAAPDPWTACTRAVGELIQIYAAVRARWLAFDDEGHLRRLRAVAPGHVRVCDLRMCEGELTWDVETWDPGHDRSAPGGDWLFNLARRIARPVYSWAVDLVAGQLAATSVYVPGAERFFLAGHGIEVAPTGDRPLSPELALV